MYTNNNTYNNLNYEQQQQYVNQQNLDYIYSLNNQQLNSYNAFAQQPLYNNN